VKPVGGGGSGRSDESGDAVGSGGALGSGGAKATGGVPGSGGAPSSGSAETHGDGGAALPCDVAAVLRTKCQGCHGTRPINGAPVSLVTYAQTQAPGVRSPSQLVWQEMQARAHDTTMTVMPPRGQPALTSAEMASLDSWFAAGAPAGTQACTDASGGTPGSGGSGGTPGLGGSGGTPSLGGSGGTPSLGGSGGTPGSGGAGGANAGIGPEYLPCTPTRSFRAHATDSATAKYPVANPTNDQYACFNFKSPLAPGEQATAWAPIIGDGRVIHHWLLYRTTTPLTDGAVTTGCQVTAQPATLLAAWTPGGQNTVLDPDVSLTLDYPYYQLQVHYNNQRYDDAADSSGVAFCTTTTPRQNVAGVVVLGTMSFSIPANANDYPVTDICSNLTADGKTPITVISTSPHMHLLGSGFRTEHMRGSMDMGDLSNIPLDTWSFDDQRRYDLVPRRHVLPGDTLRSTCYYVNPNPTAVKFGPRTSDEMCFNFVTVYPFAAATQNCSSF
jgi:hypothetical protein